MIVDCQNFKSLTWYINKITVKFDNDDNVINNKKLVTTTIIKLKDESDSNFDESDSDLDNNKWWFSKKSDINVTMMNN